MRICLQRVKEAAVHVSGREVGRIGHGFLLLVGISDHDNTGILNAMARKIMNLRIFRDLDGKSHFDRTISDAGGEMLVVSQFPLYADCRKGRRPSFSDAAPPAKANALFDQFVEILRGFPIKVETGEFGAGMDVSLINDGPVTIWLDSAELFKP
jgi:D-aminoacyl-tRNA deacylase